MTRAKSDPLEVPEQLGPLFGRTDPQTSVKASERAVALGIVHGDAGLLLSMIHEYPGRTMAWYGQKACDESGTGDDYRWRIALGRRTGPLKEAGLIEQRGEQDGMGLWWPVDQQ